MSSVQVVMCYQNGARLTRERKIRTRSEGGRGYRLFPSATWSQLLRRPCSGRFLFGLRLNARPPSILVTAPSLSRRLSRCCRGLPTVPRAPTPLPLLSPCLSDTSSTTTPFLPTTPDVPAPLPPPIPLPSRPSATITLVSSRKPLLPLLAVTPHSTSRNQLPHRSSSILNQGRFNHQPVIGIRTRVNGLATKALLKTNQHPDTCRRTLHVLVVPLWIQNPRCSVASAGKIPMTIRLTLLFPPDA